MRTFAILGSIWGLFCLFIGVAMLVGWVGNIVDVINTSINFENGEHVVMIVGIPVPPLGSFMWWFF